MPEVGNPNIFSARAAVGFVFSHSDVRPRPQALQAPHAIGNGTTTRSPTFRLCTPRPVSTTRPMNSWPRMSPLFIDGMYPSYRCRSEPQMAVDVISTIASRSFRIFGSGTSRTSTLFGDTQHVAFIAVHLPQSPVPDRSTAEP